MHQITQLRQTLQPLLGWHGARVAFLSLFLVALFRVKTVNLAEVATGFAGGAKAASNYKRIQRFLRSFELNYDQIAQLVVRLVGIPKPWVLSVDRTTWEFGSVTINILMLGVGHQGVAFPLFWHLLDKRGNSNTQERFDQLVEFLCVFAPEDIAYLTADREFVGAQWFALLMAEPVTRFRIRIRESELLFDGQKFLKTAIVFQDLQPQQSKVLTRKRRLWGHWLYLAGLRLDDGSLLVVATNHAPSTAIADYAHRWGIETWFGCLKTRGFCLEATHLKDPDRLKKLIALLTLAFCWAHQVGEWMVEQRPIKIKKHGRKARSIFRMGLDHLRQILLNLETRQAQFVQVLKLLSCT
ncbi:MAG: IS4 family transposase [Phormidesmis priestleyi]|nr:MAG: IS4 family transposase [Phormidesmis priestleyi]